MKARGSRLRRPGSREVVLALCLLVAAGLGWSNGASAATPTGMDPATATALQSELTRLRVDLGEPGLSLAIRLHDGTIWTAVTGKAQVENKHKRAVTPDTAFSAGSITKTFVGALVMQLIQRGVLHLNDRLSKWVPGYPNGKHILLSELLQHTSGLFDYFDNPKYDPAVFGHPHHLWTVPEILALVEHPYFPPGTHWHYSNTNFILLGQVLQKATRAGVGNLIRNRLLKPLHLADADFQDHEPKLPDEANGYLWSGSGWIGWDDGSNYRPNPSAATVSWTAGAMLASPSDLVRWAHALYAEGRIVNGATLNEMTDFNKHDYGLATERFFTNNNTQTQRPLWGHAGSLRGFEAQMWYDPARDVTISLMGNRGRVSLRPAIQDLLRVLYRNPQAAANRPLMEPR
jgi:D-alanyl-D-alanine carboxypeptidase